MHNLENDEVILYDGNITFKNIKKDIKFTLTNKNMLFSKEKGIFKKKFVIFKTIPVNNIKVYKGIVQVKQKKNSVLIDTIDEEISFDCLNTIEGKKIVNEILYARSGKTLFERNTNKLKNTLKRINDSREIILTIAGIIIPLLHKRKK